MVPRTTTKATKPKKAATPRAVAAAASPSNELSVVLERLEQLELRLQQLEAERDSRVAALTAPAPAADGTATKPKARTAPPSPAPEPMTDEIMTVIAAVVAAFLGERAHVRQVRLVGREAWAQQGRAAIMASHRWAVHRS